MLNFDFNSEKIHKPFSNKIQDKNLFSYLRIILGKDVKFLYLA